MVANTNSNNPNLRYEYVTPLYFHALKCLNASSSVYIVFQELQTPFGAPEIDFFLGTYNMDKKQVKKIAQFPEPSTTYTFGFFGLDSIFSFSDKTVMAGFFEPYNSYLPGGGYIIEISLAGKVLRNTDILSHYGNPMAIWQDSKGSDYFYGVMGTDPDSKGKIDYYWSQMYFGSWVGDYVVEFQSQVISNWIYTGVNYGRCGNYIFIIDPTPVNVGDSQYISYFELETGTQSKN